MTTDTSVIVNGIKAITDAEAVKPGLIKILTEVAVSRIRTSDFDETAIWYRTWPSMIIGKARTIVARVDEPTKPTHNMTYGRDIPVDDLVEDRVRMMEVIKCAIYQINRIDKLLAEKAGEEVPFEEIFE